MSRSAIALLLLLDVAAVLAVTRYLVRWWRAAPAVEAGGEQPVGERPAALAGEPDRPSQPMGVPAIGQVAAPALTVLPRVAFVPPPRRERASVRGLLNTA